MLAATVAKRYGQVEINARISALFFQFLHDLPRHVGFFCWIFRGCGCHRSVISLLLISAAEGA
jgi:hypothetical protein